MGGVGPTWSVKKKEKMNSILTKENASLVHLCVVRFFLFCFFFLPQMAFWTEPFGAPRWKVSLSDGADGYLVGVEDLFLFFSQPL